MTSKESETLELKKSTSELREAVVSVAAILNKHGRGELYFGIDDDGTVVGQEISEKTLRSVSKVIGENVEPKVYPEIKAVDIGGKSCIEIRFSGNDSPYYAFGRAYMRVSDADRQLSAKGIESLVLRKNKDKINWESESSEYGLEKVNERLLKKYVKKANDTGRINFAFDRTKTVLKKLHLMKDDRLLKAAEALFCNENSLEVQAAVFAGVDKVTFLDIRQFRGSVFVLLEKAEEYIKEHINWRAEITGLERKEIPEVPIKAVREALVNSLCHREYYAPESNKIAIFKNRLEIYNPGRFPEGLTPADFIKGEGQSILRNPLIADALYNSKEIEKWGSGLRRIYDECRSANVKVEFRRLQTGFMVVFHRREDFATTTTTTTSKTTSKTTPKTDAAILELVTNNPKITKEELASRLNITKDGVKYHIKKLRETGMLRRVGPSKGGHWEIMMKEKQKPDDRR